MRKKSDDIITFIALFLFLGLLTTIRYIQLVEEIINEAVKFFSVRRPLLLLSIKVEIKQNHRLSQVKSNLKVIIVLTFFTFFFFFFLNKAIFNYWEQYPLLSEGHLEQHECKTSCSQYFLTCLLKLYAEKCESKAYKCF